MPTLPRKRPQYSSAPQTILAVCTRRCQNKGYDSAGDTLQLSLAKRQRGLFGGGVKTYAQNVPFDRSIRDDRGIQRTTRSEMKQKKSVVESHRTTATQQASDIAQ